MDCVWMSTQAARNLALALSLRGGERQLHTEVLAFWMHVPVRSCCAHNLSDYHCSPLANHRSPKPQSGV